MEHSTTVDLIRKYLREELSEDELSAFSDIFAGEIEVGVWEEAIEAERSWLEFETSDDQMSLLKGYSKLIQKIKSRKSAIGRRRPFFKKIRRGVAAALIGAAMSLAVYQAIGFFSHAVNE